MLNETSCGRLFEAQRQTFAVSDWQPCSAQRCGVVRTTDSKELQHDDVSAGSLAVNDIFVRDGSADGHYGARWFSGMYAVPASHGYNYTPTSSSVCL